MQVETFPAWLSAAIFAAAGAVVWLAGTRLAAYADALAERTHLSRVVTISSSSFGGCAPATAGGSDYVHLIHAFAGQLTDRADTRRAVLRGDDRETGIRRRYDMSAQVVMITGASAGVGRAVAVVFARQGARIGLLARGRAGLEGARRDVEAAGGQAVILQADVADADAVERAAAQLEETFGAIDVWVNNAMASVYSPIDQTPPGEFKRVTDVTYLGVVYGTLAALRRMRPRNRGVIVQVGSALAYRGIPLQAAYCAAKHAIEGFCDSLRAELLHDGSGVHVTMVQLPALNTPQFDWVKSRLPRRGQPVPPIYQPEVAAEAIVWAAGAGRREVYVGYPTVVAIVGNKLLPGLGDAFLANTGFQAQQTDEPEDPDRPHNLWTPVDDDRDFGAHGRFDARARGTSWQLWLTQHRAAVLALLAGVGLLALLAPAGVGRQGRA